MKKLCVLGMGYIGLPTAAMFATHGFEVVGVDINDRVVEILNHGNVHIEEPGLKALVQAAVNSGNLRVVQEPEPADVFVITVPTPFVRGDGDDGAGRPTSDLSYVRSAAESLISHLRPGNLVVLESTVPPRTTEDMLLPILRESGLPIAGNGDASQRRVLVAHCPERVLPGRILQELVSNDRVIGGIDGASGDAARALYASFVEGKILLTTATTAEMAKLMENTYRDVNIALANEFSLVAEKLQIDVWEAIDLANRHPRVRILNPGPGVGGHCIAVDPWFIAEVAPDITPLIQTARAVNAGMPGEVVKRIKRVLAESDATNPVVACLGLTYKADVDDTRESPAVEVVRLLRAQGLDTRSYDPHVNPGLVPGQVASMREALSGADVVVVLTDHSEFRQLSIEGLHNGKGAGVIDTRNCLSREK